MNIRLGTRQNIQNAISSTYGVELANIDQLTTQVTAGQYMLNDAGQRALASLKREYPKVASHYYVVVSIP